MGSAVVKPLTRKRGRMKNNNITVVPSNNNGEETAAASRQSDVNCKVNPLADPANNPRQPFIGKPCKEDNHKTQSSRKVCCTYVFFSGKGKAYDSDEELGQVQLIRKETVSPSQTINNLQNGDHLSENVQKLHNPCLTSSCADPISQSQIIQGDNGEILFQSQNTQHLGCADVTCSCCKGRKMLHGEGHSIQTYHGNKAEQVQEELVAEEEHTQLIGKGELADQIGLQAQHVCLKACCIQSPGYGYMEEVKVINSNISVREPYTASSPVQCCRQSSETEMTPTARSVGMSGSKTKQFPEICCQQRLDIGDQVFIKPSPSVEYTKNQCRGAGESLTNHVNYSHNICLINPEVQTRCFQTMCQDFDLKKPNDSTSNYRCFPLCTNSPRVEGNKSVNATNVTEKSEVNETLECNENNAIYSNDSFGDVIKQSLLTGSSSTSLNRKATIMKCDKSSDSSSLNHPHVEDVLAVGEEFLDEIEEVFLQQNSSQFPCVEKGKCITPIKERDARLQSFSKHDTRVSSRSSCSSKNSETNQGWRRSRPGSSAKPSTRSSGSVLAQVSTGKAKTVAYPTSNELQADIFIQEAAYHRLSRTRQDLVNSELEYGPGYIDEMLSKGSSIPSRACSRESFGSTRDALMQSIINSDTLPKKENALPLCSSKESLHCTKEVSSQPVTDNVEKVPSVDSSLKLSLPVVRNDSSMIFQCTSNKNVMRADSKPPSKACSSSESLSNPIAALTQSIADTEITNKGNRTPSRLCPSKDSLHSNKVALSRHFSNNEIMLNDSRTPPRPCSSKSSLKSTKSVLVPSSLNTAETPNVGTIVPNACSFHESLHTDLPESISNNESKSKDKSVPSTKCSSKASLHSARLVTTQPTHINGEIPSDCPVTTSQSSSNDSVQISGAAQTNLPQNTTRKESMNPPRASSSKESSQNIVTAQTQPTMLTCHETLIFSSRQSSPKLPGDTTLLHIAPSNLTSRPPSSKRSSSSSEHNQGHQRPESSEQAGPKVGLHSHQSRHCLNISRPSSSLCRRVQSGLEVSAQEDESLVDDTSVVTRNQKEPDNVHVQETASYCESNHQLKSKTYFESAPMANITKPEATDQLPPKTCDSRSLQNSEVPAATNEEAAYFANYSLSSTFSTLNRTVKSCSRSSISKTGAGNKSEEILSENLAAPKETISRCSSSTCPATDRLTSEPTGGQGPGQAESRLAIDANSSAAMAAAQPDCLSPDKIGNIRRQLYEEGFKPAEREGGVAFFIPVTEDGMQPQADQAVVAERLTKTKKASLNYEERMFLANINRQVQLSKKKEFAVRDIRNVKGAASSSDGSDRTKQTDDVDEFDVLF